MSWCCPSAAAPCVTPSTGSVYLVHVGELIYFPAQIYHAGIFNIDNDHSDRLVIQIDDALWQACRRNANLKNAAWMHSITVLDPGCLQQVGFSEPFCADGLEPGIASPDA